MAEDERRQAALRCEDANEEDERVELGLQRREPRGGLRTRERAQRGAESDYDSPEARTAEPGRRQVRLSTVRGVCERRDVSHVARESGAVHWRRHVCSAIDDRATEVIGAVVFLILKVTYLGSNYTISSASRAGRS